MAQGSPNPSRFHSLALGRFNNFQARTDGLITDADTTPSVGLYSLLYSGSTNTLSYFDDGSEGQIVKVINLVSEQMLFSGAQMKVANSAGLWGAGDNISFINHNSSWYETSRGVASNPEVVTASAGDATPSVRGAELLIFNSGGAITVTDFDDGYAGQVLTVVNYGSAVTISNGTIINGRSDQSYVITTSDSTSYVYTGSVWFNIGIGATAV